MATSTDMHRTPDEFILKHNITSGSVEDESKQKVESTDEELENPVTEKESLQQWNNPSINTYRYLGANFSFIIMGMNDAAYGVYTPLRSSTMSSFDLDADIISRL
jgi:hypothetical protein